MNLPILTENQTTREITEQFGGYEHALRTSQGSWNEMQNMTTDYFPCASVRDKRAIVKTSSIDSTKGNVASMVSSDGELYLLRQYNNKYWFQRGDNFIDEDESAIKEFYGDKHQLVKMGANIFSFPNGVCYDSANEAVIVTKNNVAMEPKVRFRIAVESATKKNYFNLLDSNTTKEVLSTPHLISIAEQKEVVDGRKSYNNNCYRISNGALERYITSSKTWIAVQGYTQIRQVDDTGINPFEYADVGNNITLKCIGNLKFVADANSGSGKSANYKSAEIKGLLNRDNSYTADVNVVKKDFNDLGIPYIYIKGIIYSNFILDNTGYNAETRLDEGSLHIERRLPRLMHFGCCVKNRLWGCSKDGHEIYATALGTPYYWYQYNGISTDSVAFNVGTDGKFTACINYQGQPLFFKENSLHYISGSYAVNNGFSDGGSFQVTEYTDFNGVESGSERSLVIINGILYYKSKIGIMAYDGSSPVLISEALGKERYRNAVAGGYGNKYYVSMQSVRDSKYYLFVYDTTQGTWCKEDSTQAVEFANHNSGLIYAENKTDSVKIISVTDEDLLGDGRNISEDNIEWDCETDNFGYSMPDNKYVSRFQVRLKLMCKSQVKLFIQYNSDGNWRRIADIKHKGINSTLIPVVPLRCDHFKLRFEGKGDAKIISIARILEQGGDV